MIDLKFSMGRNEFKRMFFDRAAVLGAVDKATHKALNLAGGRVRVTARNSIKTIRKKVKDLSDQQRVAYRRAAYEAKLRGEPKPKLPRSTVPSAPGNAPHSQTGLLKQHIFYGFDRSTRSVVVGPARLNSRDTSAPRVLEFGGTIQIKTRGRIRRATIAARPYMGPALRKNLSFIPQAFANSIT